MVDNISLEEMNRTADSELAKRLKDDLDWEKRKTQQSAKHESTALSTYRVPEMPKGLKIFVYGTLRHDIRRIKNIYPTLPWGLFHSKATIVGTLYNVANGIYPAVKLRGDDLIAGEIIDAWPSTELPAFDRLEGHPSLFKRTQTKAKTNNGEEVDVWVYEYQLNPSEESRVIPSEKGKPVDWISFFDASRIANR